MATFREAAVVALRDAGTPLTCRQLTQKAKDMGLLGNAKSKNPVGTMSSIIHQSINAALQKGDMPEFEKVGDKIKLAVPSSGPRRLASSAPTPPSKTPHTASGKTGKALASTRGKLLPQGPGTHYVGKAGEHLVIAELLLRGFNANMMSVDEGIDVVATWHDLIYGFQVKTANLSNGTYSYNIPVKAFNKTKRSNVYYAFVLRDAECVDFLILPYADVKKAIDERNISRLKKQPLYAVTIGKKNGKIYLGKQSNDVTYYRRLWPDPGNYE